jgi:hypothetical protein
MWCLCIGAIEADNLSRTASWKNGEMRSPTRSKLPPTFRKSANSPHRFNRTAANSKNNIAKKPLTFCSKCALNANTLCKFGLPNRNQAHFPNKTEAKHSRVIARQIHPKITRKCFATSATKAIRTWPERYNQNKEQLPEHHPD